MKDYYAILGISPSAEEVVLRAAWKALAQRYHPDRFAGDAAQAHTQMAAINEAYNVLSNPDKRSAYDRSIAGKNASNGATTREGTPGQAENDADQFENDWIRAVGSHSNFGNNPEIIAFARQLLFEGNQPAAKALNDSIRELSSNVPASWLINRICEEFNVETKEMWKRRLQKEAKAREDAVWEKMREKAKTERAKEQEVIPSPPIVEPTPPVAAAAPMINMSSINFRWPGTFLSAIISVVLFALAVIWMLL